MTKHVQVYREPCPVDLPVSPSGQEELHIDQIGFLIVAVGVQSRLAVLESDQVAFGFDPIVAASVQSGDRRRQVVAESVRFADRSRQVDAGM